MKDPLINEVKKFIAERWVTFESPFLIGYSGGPDSKALLYLLLKCQTSQPFKLALVHVDHGWREESRREAEEIIKEAEKLGLVVYVKRLEGIASSNIEACAREARINYFKEVYNQIGAAGIFLAHQAEDQAETVLKRLFEGAHPSRWGGIAPDSKRHGMRLLRPLLGRSKEELIQWLLKLGKKGFEDPTNLDSKFLRGKMRKELIPLLSEHFGKEIRKNLCRAAVASRDMEAYLARRCQPLFQRQQWIGDNLHWDLRGEIDPIELSWALKYWADLFCLKVSREVLESMGVALRTLSPHCRFLLGKAMIEVKEGVLIYAPSSSNNVIM